MNYSWAINAITWGKRLDVHVLCCRELGLRHLFEVEESIIRNSK